MAATKERIYQDAARLLAEARIANVTDDIDPINSFNDAWDEAVTLVLREVMPRFALTTIGLTASGTPINFFDFNFAYPANHLRTRAIYAVTPDGREHPVDIREGAHGVSANVSAITMQYVSSFYADLAFAPWPEHTAQALAAYLAVLVAERLTGEPNATGRMSQLFSQFLSQAQQIDGVAEDKWLRFQRTGEMLRGARDLGARANWRFALVGKVISTKSGTPLIGFSNSFAWPADRLRTHKLFVNGALPERPLDIRETGGFWSTSADTFVARYVSATHIENSIVWPQPFSTGLLAYLEAGRPQQQAEGEEVPQWQGAVALAIAAEADPDDRWLDFQLGGAFGRATHAVLHQGFWSYRDAAGVMRGLKEAQYSAGVDQSAEQPSYVYPYRFPLPEDWFKSYAFFVPWDGDKRPIPIVETAHEWSTNAPVFVAEYISTDVLDATGWPEAILDAVWTHCAWKSAPADKANALAEAHALALAIAKKEHSRPENEWLKYQLDGTFIQAVRMLLESGRWRFALRTATLEHSTDPLPAEFSTGDPEYSFAYRHIWPNDLLRTVRVYYEYGVAPYSRRHDVNYADIGGAYHTNQTPVTVRYVSRMGLDSTKWTAHFKDAALAWLQYNEARNDPAMTSVAAAKLQMYERAIREAERVDDARDHVVVRGSRFVDARRGWGRVVDRTDFVPTYIGPPIIEP